MDLSLIILAAGMASRYGAIKQLRGFGPNNETLMEYSIYDAIRAGFTEVIFVIKPEHQPILKENIEKKISTQIKVKYAYQELQRFTHNYPINKDRTKPWGTAHALLCCQDIVKNPFCVINSDDLYGKSSFLHAFQFIKNLSSQQECAIIGFQFEKTLSNHGTVSRGICEVDSQYNLISIKEILKIFKNKNNKIVYYDDSKEIEIADNSIVSMNFFCFTLKVFSIINTLFDNFLKDNCLELTKEFYLPFIVDNLVHSEGFKCLVLPSTEQWYGITYQQDDTQVKDGIKKLIDNNVYPAQLWQ